jgi:hypothetical protein
MALEIDRRDLPNRVGRGYVCGFDNFAERLGRSETEPLHVKLRYCHLSPRERFVHFSNRMTAIGGTRDDDGLGWGIGHS